MRGWGWFSMAESIGAAPSQDQARGARGQSTPTLLHSRLFMYCISNVPPHRIPTSVCWMACVFTHQCVAIDGVSNT